MLCTGGDVDTKTNGQDGKQKTLPTQSFETYCSQACRKVASECYFEPLCAAAARGIAKLRRELFEGAKEGEAPIASSYHVLGALRLAAMTLAERHYKATGD